MGGKPRSRPVGLVDLARAVEEQQRVVAAEQAVLAGLRDQLAAAASATLPMRNRPAPPAEPAAESATSARRGKRRKRFNGTPEYWESKRSELLGAMKAGTLYTGADLEALAPSEGGPPTFVRQVRDVLTKSKSIKKVAEDGSSWRKGMFPASARWVKN